MTQSITVKSVTPGPGNVVEVFVDSWSVHLVGCDHYELAKDVSGLKKIGINNRLKDWFVGNIIIREINQS